MTAKKLMVGILSLLVVLIGMAPSLMAQSQTTGDIAGTVTDASGAVVPNASVSLKNNAEGYTLPAQQTSSAGTYRFSSLKPGAYTMTVTAPGMATAELNVMANVGAVNTVPVKMSVAGAKTTVEVTTAVPLINTENADLQTGFSTAQIAAIPVPGNDITSYAYSAPGVVVNTGSGYGNFSAFGLPSTANLFTTNGNDNMDPYLNLNNSGASNLALGSNELAQIAVVNNAYTAEYGRQAGTQMNATTKSGTNSYHGNLFYQWNGRELNANDWFGANSGTEKPFANNNAYGASFGGPIIKNKLFIFGDFEALRYVLPGAGGNIFIPTPAFENYVLTNPNGIAQTPGSAPFYNNIFNLYNNANGASRATPVTSMEDPSGGGGCGDFAGTAGFGGANPCARFFRSTNNSLNTEWLLSVRGDWNISNNDKFNMRFRTDHGIQATGTDPINQAFSANSIQPEFEGQINETHVFNSTMVNNFILSGMWYSAIFGPANFQNALATFPTEMIFADGAPFTTLGGGDFAYPQGRIVTQYMFTDDFSWTRGRHDLKFGANFRRNLVSDYSNESGISGEYILGSMTEFTQGLFGTDASTYAQNFPQFRAVQTKLYNLGVFAQDQWKVSPKLSLTLGLRADIVGNPGCKPGCYSRFNTDFNSLSHDVTIPYNQAITTGQGQAFQSQQQIAWGPRFGVAYNIYPNTVLRGGIGLFSDMYPGTIVDRFITNTPNNFAASAANNGPISFDLAGNPRQQSAQSSVAFQQGFASGATLAQLQQILQPFGGFSPPAYQNEGQQIKIPEFLEWNFQIEQQFSDRYSLAINYVGNHGYNIFTINPFNNAFCKKNCTANGGGFFGSPSQGFLSMTAPDARFQQVNSILNQGYSNSNGITATFKMRFSSAFQANFNYTWSHANDTCSNNCLEPFTANTVVSLRYATSPLIPGTAYGNSDYDVRQLFSANYVWNTKSNYSSKWMNAVLGNWVVAGAIYYHTGYPWSPVSTSVRSDLGNVTPLRNGTPLTDFLGGPIGGCGGPAQLCVAQGQFATGATQNDFGNVNRNSFRGAGYFDTDLNVTKNFKITERMQFGLGFNFFNLFNHPNFDLPANNTAAGNFGVIQTTVLPATTPYGAFAGVTLSGRIAQVTGRFTF